jgi:hypothetical protein
MSELAAVATPPNRPTRSRAATRAAWVDRLQRFSQSGLSPAPFCAVEGVSLPSFSAWKRRLAAESLQLSSDVPGPRLLPVRLHEPSATIELALPCAVVGRIAAGAEEASLRYLLATSARAMK